jgi:transcriptional regulator with XRE-family HTH domain
MNLVVIMAFPQRLAEIRKKHSLTQQALADKTGVHVIQIRRYETGKAQPTLDVIRNLSIALNVSSDQLLFDDTERGPDEEFKYQFEAISKFDDEEKMIIKAVLDSLILRHEARRLAS